MTVQEKAPLLSAPPSGELTGSSTRAVILRYLSWANETNAQEITVHRSNRHTVMELIRSHYPGLADVKIKVK